MKLITKGKVKEVYEVDGRELEFRFTDQISVFDKIIPSSIPRKGETLNKTSVFWFEKLRELGVKTHYISSPAANVMRVKRVNVIHDYYKMTGDTRNFLIPLEVICRHYIAGSLNDKILRGEITGEMLGFEPGHTPKYGEKLPKPMIEFTTKLEPVDRKLTEEEALEISGLSIEELSKIKDIVLLIDKIIAEVAAANNLIHVDGKKEFGMDENRNIMLLDTFGTLDEDRWWDMDKWQEGKINELSKEFVRMHYRNTGYFSELEDARAKGLPEPDIPALPPDVIAQTTELYVRMYERITGRKL
ncbi:MAG: phosphoribosylaminoimidazolesuccinocarboxamide synthase [Candidatus Aenigmarchaeota archaeon]|nr:phosphoribosylaminoimidazolesuccinocarboxamide synthase [Candidatus Aenigmarchaeota archaeon]